MITDGVNDRDQSLIAFSIPLPVGGRIEAANVDAGQHVWLDLAGGVERDAGGAGARAGLLLDDYPPDV